MCVRVRVCRNQYQVTERHCVQNGLEQPDHSTMEFSPCMQCTKQKCTIMHLHMVCVRACVVVRGLCTYGLSTHVCIIASVCSLFMCVCVCMRLVSADHQSRIYYEVNDTVTFLVAPQISFIFSACWAPSETWVVLIVQLPLEDPQE